VFESLKRSGFEVFLDDSTGSLNKKVRNAQLLQFNYIAVIGEQEVNE
jgi:threonyl-tRNA synthetase